MKRQIILLLVIVYTLNLASASIHLPPQQTKTPDDIVYQHGSTGNQIIWAFNAQESGDNPSKYTVTVNDVDLAGHTLAPWEDNVDIVVDVDGLEVGVYTYKITVNDTGVDTGAAEAKIDSVTVTVISETANLPSTTTTPAPSDSSDPSKQDDANFGALIIINTLIIASLLKGMKKTI